MSQSWHHVWIRPEEPLAVEVDHVVGVFGDPDFGFPGDVRDEGLHGAAGLEGGDEDEARFAAGEEVFEFLATLAVDWGGADDGFDEQEPVLGGVVDDDIGNLGGGMQGDSERGQACGIVVGELVLGVGEVEHVAAGSEGGTELFDYRLHQQAPTVAGRIKPRAVRQTPSLRLDLPPWYPQ